MSRAPQNWNRYAGSRQDQLGPHRDQVLSEEERTEIQDIRLRMLWKAIKNRRVSKAETKA